MEYRQKDYFEKDLREDDLVLVMGCQGFEVDKVLKVTKKMLRLNENEYVYSNRVIKLEGDMLTKAKQVEAQTHEDYLNSNKYLESITDYDGDEIIGHRG